MKKHVYKIDKDKILEINDNDYQKIKVKIRLIMLGIIIFIATLGTLLSAW